MTIQSIPLSQLVPSPANVRKVKTGIDGLAASIAAHGLLQNLTVRPVNGNSFEVLAGGRRLAALQSLAKQKKIAGDFPVPCDAREDSADTEISLAKNEMRQAMHPADRFDAFKKLADEGQGEDTVAAKFGMTPLVVRQRLKLANVSPKILTAYRKDDLSLECVMAFTVTDDHRAQERVWKEWKQYPEYEREPEHIRDLLTKQHVDADNKLVKLQGEVTAEGWKWVEIMPDIDYSGEPLRATRNPGKDKESFTGEQKSKSGLPYKLVRKRFP